MLRFYIDWLQLPACLTLVCAAPLLLGAALGQVQPARPSCLKCAAPPPLVPLCRRRRCQGGAAGGGCLPQGQYSLCAPGGQDAQR